VQVKETAQLPWAFRQAFRIAREGRPGPVLIDLPLNVQKGPDVDWDPDGDRALEFERPTPNPAAIREAVAMLLQAERPMIMPGGGVILADAAPALMALAEYLQIPVTPTYMGKGAIREDHPLYAGIVGIQTSQRYANALFLESDFVLAVGARFADRHTGDLAVYRGERTFVQVDIEPYQIGRVFPPDLGIVSDARHALDAMLEVARDMTPPRAGGAWTERVTELRSTLLRKEDFDDVPINPQRVYKEVNGVFDEDTVFLTAIGLYQIFSGQFQKAYRPRHYLCCGQAGPLGWEVPACIGAKLGAPEKLIVGILGDYSFQFLMEEVAVAVQYRVPFVLVMLNNQYMGLIRQAEKYGYDQNYAVDLSFDNDGTVGIDHVGIMEAMGATGRRVTEPGDIADALEWAIAASGERQVPVLVEIMTERDTDAAMGVAIDAINEYEPVLDGAYERPGAVVGALPERD
jgi:tartronate-semialdehyde synthase